MCKFLAAFLRDASLKESLGSGRNHRVIAVRSEVVGILEKVRGLIVTTSEPLRAENRCLAVIADNYYRRQALSAEVYKKLKAGVRVAGEAPATRPIRAFISYTETDGAHKDWVASLGTFLRENGVDARLDQWHLRPGMDLQQWMANELQLADRVLVVSNEGYAAKADVRHGGVGWETMLIQGDMARRPPDSTKYLVVLRSEDFDKGLPFYLRTKFAIHWPASAKNEATLKQRLLDAVLDVDRTPPLREAPIILQPPPV